MARGIRALPQPVEAGADEPPVGPGGGLIDPGNAEMSKNLRTIYGAMGLPDTAVLNTAIPLVRQQVNEAGVMVVHLFEEAKQPDRAQEFGERFVRENSVLPELLKPAP